MSDQIEIKIDGKKLTPEKFIEAAKSFFDLIEGVAKNVTSEPIKWGVELDKGSAIIRAVVKNPSRASSLATDVICKGVRSLRSGVRTLPPGFTKTEVVATRRLAAIIDGGDVKSVSIKNGSAPEDLPQSVIVTADAILSGEATTAFGSIEGIVDSMSVKHGFICSIQDSAYRREITCYFSKDEVAKEARRGFEKRVMASGLIRYAREGHPTSIVVDAIRIFPEESELPTIEEVQALFK
jgi:hypothetical protein